MGQGALSKPVVQWWLSLNSSSEYPFGEFMLVAAGFHMQPDGIVPPPVCARADAWLRRVASSSPPPRAVLGISAPTEAELKKQAAFQGKARARAKVVS